MPATIFEMAIELRAVRPAVLRRVQVRGEMSLAELHEVVQWGYDEFVTALADAAHPDHQRYREWLGGRFDPAAFDLDAVNRALAEIT